MSPKRKHHVSLTSSEKMKLLQDLQKGLSQSSVASKYQIDRSTVSKIKQNSQQIRKDNLENKLQKKRYKVSSGEKIEEPLLIWFRQTRSQNIPINGPMLLEKAASLAIQFNSTFVPSTSWLERLKKREGISFQKLHGEEKKADKGGTHKWKTEEFVDIDKDEFSSGILTDAEVCAEVYSVECPKDELTEETEDKDDATPTIVEALKMVNSLRLFCANLPEAACLQMKLNAIESAVENQIKTAN